MKKRILSLLLALATALSIIALSACELNTGSTKRPKDSATPEDSAEFVDDGRVGSGTYDDPYIVRDRETLESVRTNDGEGVYFRMVKSIDLSVEPFEAFNPFEDFLGNFDGGNNYIYNFFVTDKSHSDIGLFRQNHGVIANLKISSTEDKGYSIGVSLGFQKVRVGGLVAVNYGKVINCGADKVNIDISATYKTSSNQIVALYVGSLIGVSPEGSEVRNCFAINNTLRGNSKNSGSSTIYGFGYDACMYSGGLAGLVNGNIQHCYAYGNVINGGANAQDSVYGYLGGLAGCLNTETAKALIAYSNSFSRDFTHKYSSATLSVKVGNVVGKNSYSMFYVFGKTGDTPGIAGEMGTNYYCQQIDLETFKDIGIFKEEGVWALDVKTEEIEGEEGQEPTPVETVNVAFNEKSRYVFEKPEEEQLPDDSDSSSGEEE